MGTGVLSYERTVVPPRCHQERRRQPMRAQGELLLAVLDVSHGGRERDDGFDAAGHRALRFFGDVDGCGEEEGVTGKREKSTAVRRRRKRRTNERTTRRTVHAKDAPSAPPTLNPIVAARNGSIAPRSGAKNPSSRVSDRRMTCDSACSKKRWYRGNSVLTNASLPNCAPGSSPPAMGASAPAPESSPTRVGVTTTTPLDARCVRSFALFDAHVSGSFHTSERRDGVQRRQLELKGIEGGD